MGCDVAKYRSKFITKRAINEEAGNIFVDLEKKYGQLAFKPNFPVMNNIAVTTANEFLATTPSRSQHDKTIIMK
jgi:hypothetical protein